jgi:histidinol dehydrogenase
MSARGVQPSIRRLSSAEPGFSAALTALLAYEAQTDASVAVAVEAIVNDVRARGDEALLEYTRRFDRLPVTEAAALELSPATLAEALAALARPEREALEAAAGRVRDYHERQLAHSWEHVEPDGTRLGQRITPLDRVGLYVPGGKAAYPSSVLMNAVPARVAGVGELIMVVPTPDGARNPMVLAAAAIAGVDRVFTIGGAQAVAALAFGTATVPAVDKIVGPGNAYVAEAKRRVFGTVGIDMIAGPSEILVITDGSVDPDWVAMDLFSQAEHDELAQAILLCPDPGYIERVHQAIGRLLPGMSRRAVIERSLADRGALICVRDMEEACSIASAIAAEHLEIIAVEPRRWADRIRHAGAIFLGPYASESLGDYCAGPNHVLPTMRTARFSSPLGVYDFQKRSSMIEIARPAAQTLGRIASVLARGEGLEAHARSAELRLDPQQPADAVAAAGGAPGDSEPSDRAALSAGDLDRRVATLLRADVREMASYHVPSSSGLVKLDAMENPYRLPEALRVALATRLADALINRYPVPSYAGLKRAIVARLGVPAGYDVLLGNGSDELITMLCVATARPGAVMLAPVPSFVMYEVSAKLAGSRFVGVPLAPDLSLDLPAMLAAIARHRPAIVFLAYPNNPTGNCFEAAQIEAILRAAPGLVVLDEAYQPFAIDSWMPRLPAYPNMLVMRTLSKLGLAGLRLGYLSGHARWLAELDKVRPPYNIGVLNEVAAEFALEHLAVFDEQAADIRAERERLHAALQTVSGARPIASHANFLLVRVADSAAVQRRMRELGVLVKDVGKMHPLLVNCLRVTVGAPAENQAMLAALADALKSLPAPAPAPASAAPASAASISAAPEA